MRCLTPLESALRLLLPAVAVLSSVLSAPSGLVAQSREERLDAVQEFERFYRKVRETEQRVEAIKTLERVECPEAARALADLLDERDEAIVRTAAEILASYREPATFEPFVDELVEMNDADEQARMIRILGEAGQKGALPKLREIMAEKRVDDAVRLAVARALGDIGTDDEADLLAQLLRDDEARVRLAAADSAGKIRAAGVGAELIALLDDDEWQVRSAAVQACGEVRVAEAIEPLIGLMEEHDGSVDEECAEALFQITAYDFGMDAAAWRKLWERLRKLDWRPPTDEELAKAAASREKYDALYGKKDDAPSFGGIKTVSTAILFIIDVSGSMEDEVVDRAKFENAGYEDLTKLGIVKKELGNTIDSLEPTTRFNILAFARDRDPWKRFLVPANVVNKRSAKRWVERLDVVGGSQEAVLAGAGIGDLAAGKTNTFSALMFPFGIDPEKPSRGPTTGSPIDNEIETVFFLSDGRPTAGKVFDEQEIIDEVLRLNEDYKIVIHTIAIGEVQRTFMQRIASGTGGVFVDLGR